MSSLDSNGLVIDRLPEILESIETDEQSLVDPNLSFESDTVLGHLNNIMAERYASLNQLAQAVYDAFNIMKAEGKNLDDLAFLRGITRIAADYSNTNRQLFVGDNGTTIPYNSIFANPISGDTFTNPAEIQIDSLSCNYAKLEVMNVLDNEEYQITVNGTVYSYTSSASATANEILSGLKTEIDNDPGAEYTAALGGDVLTIETSDYNNKISVTTVTYISITEVGVEGYIRATETGPIVAPINSVTQIISVISGLTSTTNLEQLVLGRSEETDEELRSRIINYGSSNCTGTIPSIESAIFNNVEGVSSVSITENTKNSHIVSVSSVAGTFSLGEAVVGGTSGAEGQIIEIIDTDEFRIQMCSLYLEEGEQITGLVSGATATIDKSVPPHSYETVVVGGDNTEVAEEIWRTKPAGIELYGNTEVVILDSNGNSRTIRFTRPVAVNFAVKVTYSLYDEESFPVDGEDSMREAIVEHINGLGLDVDVIPGRMFGPIYNSTAGLEDITVEIQVIPSSGDTPDPGSWQSTTIAVENNEFASIGSVDVYFETV